MAEQTVLFTPIPGGVSLSGTRVRVVVHVGPRLLTAGTLTDAEYPDWVDWPATVATALSEWELRFPGLGPTFAVPATLVTEVLPDGTPLPSSEHWSRLFPPGTPVNGRRMPKLTHRLLHSYSTETVSEFLKERWGRFGSESPEDHPSFDLLLDDAGFSPIAFDRLQRAGGEGETGPERRHRLQRDNAGRLDAGSPSPDAWAIAHGSLPAAPDKRRDEIGRRFLELEHFHVRDRQGPQRDVLPESPKAPTFHELVAMVQRYPKLLRALGLVLVLEADITAAHHGATMVEAASTWVPAVQNHRPVYARTMCELSPTAFRAAPDPNNDGDLVGRQLRLGDSLRFRVDTVDPDSGAIRAMQFADNVARSRPEPGDGNLPYSAFTRAVYPMPAQASAGITVSRNNRANRFAHLLQRVEDTNGSAFDGVSGVPLGPLPGQDPPAPVFWADDLVRGYRWDVKSGADPRWRSLMETQGRYVVGQAGDTREIEAAEEGVSATGATSAGGPNPPDDLYLHESLVHWGGWSLAARPPGATVGRDDGVADPTAPTAPDGSTPAPLAPLDVQVEATPGSLPRLRFGGTYRMRARAVDIAGESDAVDAPTEAQAESEEVEYLRYEPVSAPLAALHQPVAIPGETNTTVVVRTENKTDLQHSENRRHLVPPRTNIAMAEQHGKLDTDQAGQPLDLGALTALGQRDAQDLSMHPDIQPPAPGPIDERWFPVETVGLNYLPDPLAKKALVRDLPAVVGGVDHAVLDLAVAAWPDWTSTRLTVETADTTGWEVIGGKLVVRLAKGEDRFVRLSSLFDESDVSLMALWPWIAEWHLSHGGSTATLDDLRNRVKAGRHWMFTPWQTMRLVHAVRTPLLDPVLPNEFSAVKNGSVPAATFADIRWEGAYSRKTTAQLELLANWSTKVDNGPERTPNPTEPQQFRAVAATIPLDHRSTGPDGGPFQVKHEFGDTKYRSVHYQAVATSAFTEFFRESVDVVVPAPVDPADPPPPIPVDDRGLVASTVVVKSATDGFEYRQGPAADYTVDEVGGSLLRSAGSSIASGGTLTVSFVAPEIHTTSATRTREIKSSARPAAPKVEYVVPTFRWQRDGNTSTRRGNTLRVYLKRPWWSSGDDERLGVVLWRKPTNLIDPPESLQPFVTMWGLDPVFAAPGVSTTPVLASFPLATDKVSNLPLAELGNVTVDVAAHEVHFDGERDLWYADIELNFGLADDAYFPFVRLALVRYQPHSLTGVEISPVVLTDFTQVTPDRSVSVSGSGSSRTVQVVGRSYATNSSALEPSRVQVLVERSLDGIDDAHLRWQQVGTPVSLTRSITSNNLLTWSGAVAIPSTSGAKRLVVEELEVHRTGTEANALYPPNGRRVVYTDIINL